MNREDNLKVELTPFGGSFGFSSFEGDQRSEELGNGFVKSPQINAEENVGEGDVLRLPAFEAQALQRRWTMPLLLLLLSSCLME